MTMYEVKPKKYTDMTPEEKKARIKQLWKRLRRHVMFERRFINASKKQVTENHLFSFVQQDCYDWETIRK